MAAAQGDLQQLERWLRAFRGGFPPCHVQQKVFRCSGWALTWKGFLTSPCSWIHTCLRKADKNKDNKMSLKELKDFLKEVNIEVDDYHAKKIFQVMGASRKRV